MKVSEIIAQVITPAYIKQMKTIGYASFLWYVGTDSVGTKKVFRFSKGAAPEFFQRYAADQGFVDVTGPFATQKAASETVDQ